MKELALACGSASLMALAAANEAVPAPIKTYGTWPTRTR